VKYCENPDGRERLAAGTLKHAVTTAECAADRGRHPDNLSDLWATRQALLLRLLTLDLLRRAAADRRDLLRTLTTTGPGKERRARAKPKTKTQTGFHSPVAFRLVTKNLRNIPLLKSQHCPTAALRREAVELY
jgi:hypothetical protein